MTDARDPSEFGELLAQCRDGDDSAVGRLFAHVYQVLYDLAKRHMRGQARGHTLQPTELLNEAYLRLSKNGGAAWENRAHFLNAASVAMRTALVDHARRRSRERRGGGKKNQVPFESVELEFESRAIDLLELDEALERLKAVDPRLTRLVELRFFAGCTMEEAAQILVVGKRQAEKDWSFTRQWLFRELGV